MCVYIEESLCKGCGLCVHFCPRDVLSMSERLNQKGYNVVEVIHPEKCKPCKLCEMNCPDLAIWVEREESRGAPNSQKSPAQSVKKAR